MHISLSRDMRHVTYQPRTTNGLVVLGYFFPLIATIITLISHKFQVIGINILFSGIISYFGMLLISFGSDFLHVQVIKIFIIIIILLIRLYILLQLVRKGNLLAVKARIKNGYSVRNESDPQIAAYINEAKNTKKPFLIL